MITARVYYRIQYKLCSQSWPDHPKEHGAEYDTPEAARTERDELIGEGPDCYDYRIAKVIELRETVE